MILATSKKLIIKEVAGKEAVSESGIILSKADVNTTLGEILSIGPDCVNKFKIGDHIVPVWNKVQHFRIGGVNLFAIHEDDVLGVSR
jgi:co-chaperonin GroES (HSP10)